MKLLIMSRKDAETIQIRCEQPKSASGCIGCPLPGLQQLIQGTNHLCFPTLAFFLADALIFLDRYKVCNVPLPNTISNKVVLNKTTVLFIPYTFYCMALCLCL
jgi:hypothetical protein